ncbi:PAS domain-containing sensor histidine kinase [Haloglomus litoreum]|uniref:PAS domain-containing sensor histidine kinase n=1 Tax=Haloglomus litoreum TaxID=3034026 RepID=UPI0023E7B12F|nr:PAS domain S-box protein [Haloglomus sp. DT116]
MSRSPSLGVLLDHTRDMVILVDEAGTITYANGAVEDILGRSPEDFEGRTVFDEIHPDDIGGARAAFEETIESESFVETTCEYRCRAADGSWVWLESRMSNLTDDELDGYVCSSRDITDRVEAQQDREAMTRRLQELSATTGDVLWMFTADFSELLFVNPAYEDVYGGSIEALEADPQRFLDTIHPDDVEAVREAMACLDAGNPIDMEYRVNPDRDYRTWVWVQAEPIVEDGEVARITGFTRDITDRYRRERHLYVMDNLLRHNIRNDVNTISGTAELIKQDAPEVAEQAAVIRKTGDDLLRSAEKERDIIELLTGPVTAERVDVVVAVERAIETISDRGLAADVTVSAPETADAQALPELHLAIAELIENAILHSDADAPPVPVTVEVDAERIGVLVESETPPIPEMEVAVLRGDHEMDGLYHSTGLGLWLVYWVVELSDGRIEVSRHDSLNRIRIELPRRGR